MFEASVDGEAFDMDRWGQYFKPAGYSSKGDQGSTAKAVPAASAPIIDEEDEDTPAVVTTPEPATEDSGASNRAQDILKMIRNRQQSN
jgi:hypothetical protein